MPKNHDAKTGSAPKELTAIPAVRPARPYINRLAITGLIAVVTAGMAASFLTGALRTSPCSETYRNDRLVTIRNHQLRAEIAAAPAAREKGLSGKSCLPEGQAMLFTFDIPGDYCFWMKDMNFAIDMVWLDAQKNVVHLAQNSLPSSYPKSYCPGTPSQYVLELPKGGVERLELAVGDHVGL